jgi:hypothetical protein
MLLLSYGYPFTNPNLFYHGELFSDRPYQTRLVKDFGGGGFIACQHRDYYICRFCVLKLRGGAIPLGVKYEERDW